MELRLRLVPKMFAKFGTVIQRGKHLHYIYVQKNPPKVKSILILYFDILKLNFRLMQSYPVFRHH